MKMIFAIVSNEDASKVIKALNQEHFSATRLASSGGFLLKGNTTIISGVQDDQVQRVKELIKEHSKKRTQLMPIDYPHYSHGVAPYPVEITIGGATIFVMDVESYEKD